MFSLNSVTKNWLFEPATSCAKDQDAATVPERHRKKRRLNLSSIHASVIYQISKCAEFTEFQIHLGKTPLRNTYCSRINLFLDMFYETGTKVLLWKDYYYCTTH